MIWRTLMRRRIWLGYFLSAAAASVTQIVAFNFLTSSFPASSILLFAIFVIVVLYTIVPSLFFIFFCERKNKRSLLFYLLFSGLLSVVGLPLVTTDFDLDMLFRALFFLPAGLVSGFTYWYFSGRHAGKNLKEFRKQIEVFE